MLYYIFMEAILTLFLKEHKLSINKSNFHNNLVR